MPKVQKIYDLSLDKNLFIWPFKNCRKSVSTKKGKVFSKRVLENSKILMLGYMRLIKISIRMAIQMSGHCSDLVVSLYST